MTDKELLEKAAKAAGMSPDAFSLDDDEQPIHRAKGDFFLLLEAGGTHLRKTTMH